MDVDERIEAFLRAQGVTDAELLHYGVVGMRWGKRTNPGYQHNQIKRDTQVYGKRGATRINKALNAGDSISVARGSEKTRRDRVMGKNKYVRQVGKIGGAATGAVVGFLAARGLAKAANSQHGRAMVNKLLGNEYGTLANVVLNNPIFLAGAAAGAAKVGHMLSGDIAVGINMRAHGYDPNRK